MVSLAADASKFINQSGARITHHLRGSSADTAQEAPLFYSAADAFASDEDDHNRERDALKASRRNFGAFFGLGAHPDDAEGRDGEDDDSFISDEATISRRQDASGLAASWRPAARTHQSPLLGRALVIPESAMEESEASTESNETMRRIDDPPFQGAAMAGEEDGQFYFSPEESLQMSVSQALSDDVQHEVPLDDDDDDGDDATSNDSDRSHRPFPQRRIGQSDLPTQTFRADPPIQPLSPETLPRPVSAPPIVAASHDSAWSALYGLAMAGMFATSFMIWLGTQVPDTSTPLGDTIYQVLHTAFPLLISDAILAVGIAILWLILMRHALQTFVYLLLFTVPIAMFTFFLIPLLQSFRGRWHGNTIQDWAMRLGSVVPLCIGLWWTWKVWSERLSVSRAISVIALSGKIVTQNSALVPFSFAGLAAFVVFTFVWVLMFSRVFLRTYTVLDGGTTPPHPVRIFVDFRDSMGYSYFLLVVGRVLYFHVSMDLGSILRPPKVISLSWKVCLTRDQRLRPPCRNGTFIDTP